MSSSAETVAAEHSSAQPGDVLSTRWLPGAPPKLMEKLEGWGYDKMPDLSGKTFIVTGGNSGIGREVSKHLALKGAHVVIASPDIERAEDAIAAMRSEIAAEAAKGAEGVAVGGHGNLEYKALDLAQLESIRTFARDIARRNAPLHGLVCNASVQLRAEETTADGMEQRWGEM